MSIPTKQIDGDVAIGRNVSTGGSANIQGNARIGHNLKVDGWLEARNIKGPNKGVFASESKLKEAYPLPHAGWWALVGETLPAPLYIADGGEWVATGRSAGNPTIDCQQYNDAVAELRDEVAELKGDVATNSGSIEAIVARINAIGETAGANAAGITRLEGRMKNAEATLATTAQNAFSATNTAAAALQTASEANNTAGTALTNAAIAKERADDARKRVEDIELSVAAPSGIAPLDENGLVPARFIPGAMDDVVEFAGIIDLVPDVQPKGENAGKGCVRYCSVTKKFIWEAARTLEGTATYYNDWEGGRYYGEPTDDGRSPVSGKVYVDITTNKQYRWAGTTMAVVGTDLALGHTAQTAYPGDQGHSLSKQVFSLQQTLSNALDETKTELEESITEVACRVSAVADDLSAYKSDVGIYSFSGFVVHVDEVRHKPEGAVWFAIQECYFVTLSGGSPSHSLPHNKINRVGSVEGVKTNAIFRCENVLYVSPSGSMLQVLESDTLRKYIDSVKNGAKQDVFDLEERLPIFRFDGMVRKLADLDGGEIDTIWYVIDDKRFYTPEETGTSPNVLLNDWNGEWPVYARRDAIFYCDGDLYCFDGDNLVDWEPWKLREDVDDLAIEVEEAREALSADVARCEERIDGIAVMPFDMFAPNDTGQPFEGMAVGQIAFISSSGLFAMRTASGRFYPGSHNELGHGGGPIGARRDCLFRCGNRLYRFEDGMLREMVDSGVAEADREQTRRDFIGVWDEIESIKDMIAAIASNEVHELLGQLGYGQEDIADYIYFNLHGYCEVTMDELRLSAWRWTHRDELEGVPVLYVFPNLQDEWKEEGFDILSLCRTEYVKYLNYVWVKNGSVSFPFGPGFSAAFIKQYEVANIGDDGELLDGEDAKFLNHPGGFVYHLHGNISYASTRHHGWKPCIRHFNTSQDHVAVGCGIFVNQELDGNNAISDVNKINKLYDKTFYRCTLKNFNVGEWDCSEALDSFYGSRIVDSHLILDLKNRESGDTGGKDLLQDVKVDNSTIEMNNVPAVGDKPSYFFYTMGPVLNAGGKETVSVFASNNLTLAYLPGLVSVNGAATILDMPELRQVISDDGIRTTEFGEPMRVDMHWGAPYYRRVFLRNIGGQSISPLWIYQMFDISRDPTTAQSNIDLFVECGRTWADRKVPGGIWAQIYISKKLMDTLTPEQKSVFTSKGYTIISVIE